MTVNNSEFTISDKQLLLKGAVLQNTDWVVALCCYTGDETKILLNSQMGRQKISHLEGMVNKLVLNIVCVQTITCTIMAILAQRW